MKMLKFAIVVLSLPLAIAGCEKSASPADTCVNYLGLWTANAVTMQISRSGDTYLLEVNNPAGMLGGNFTATCQNGLLTTTAGAAVVLHGDGTLNYAGITMQKSSNAPAPR